MAKPRIGSRLWTGMAWRLWPASAIGLNWTLGNLLTGGPAPAGVGAVGCLGLHAGQFARTDYLRPPGAWQDAGNSLIARHHAILPVPGRSPSNLTSWIRPRGRRLVHDDGELGRAYIQAATLRVACGRDQSPPEPGPAFDAIVACHLETWLSLARSFGRSHDPAGGVGLD
jgi:hypothetical protein